MSTNLKIKASRDILVLSTREFEVDSCWYLSDQTPQEVTRKIIASSDPLKAYKDYLNEISIDEVHPVYADDAVFGEPLGYETVNFSKIEIERLEAWVEDVQKRGYTLEFLEW